VAQCVKYSSRVSQWLPVPGTMAIVFCTRSSRLLTNPPFRLRPKIRKFVLTVSMDHIKSCCHYYNKVNDEVECVEVIGIRDILMSFYIPLMLFDFRKKWIGCIFDGDPLARRFD
jgi:hypothetical protein